ncbi:MAG: serine/threonine-protein kinase [Pirellulaceae bacterium]
MIARFHYDKSALLRLLADEPSSEDSKVRAHVETCDYCQDQLDALSVGSMSWDDVADWMRRDDLPDVQLPDSTSTEKVGVTFLESSESPDSLGRFGRYEILEVLGRGGMGVVMRGVDSALNRSCAIKVLAPELAGSGAARKRFSREAKSAAAVVHPHVVPIQNVDEHNGLPYLVMPVVEGRSLQQRVENDGPLEVVEVIRIAAQIADGLSAAHGQGLVHRDIKPANILLESGVDRVRITDFGLARAVDDASMTHSGVIAGTPQYMSPEQSHGDTINHRSDLFSLGSVMYFMLTGRSPFRAETSMGVLNRICNDQPRSLRSINADVPTWLERIIMRLLEKSPDDRFQSASEVAKLLAEHLTRMSNPDAGHIPDTDATELTSEVRANASEKPPNHVRASCFPPDLPLSFSPGSCSSYRRTKERCGSNQTVKSMCRFESSAVTKRLSN